MKCARSENIKDCILTELRESAKECFLNCLGSKNEQLVEKIEPTQEIQVNKQLVIYTEEEKNSFFECLRKCVTFREALRIVTKCYDAPEMRECILKEIKDAGKQFFINCLN